MAVKDARSLRAAQRSKILDGHRSGGYARQRALSTSRNSLPRGAPFYNAWADHEDSQNRYSRCPDLDLRFNGNRRR